MNKNGQYLASVAKQTNDHNFFLADDNSFIHIDFDEKVVLRIDKSGRKTTLLDTKPLHPFMVGEALDGNILVTLVDCLSDAVPAQSERKIQMLTRGGKTLHTYQFGEDGVTSVLNKPFRPVQNYNSNVCVLSSYQTDTNSHRGKMFVFHEDGGFKSVYTGHHGEFNPSDICCDNVCNILCVNMYDSSVHIVDSECKFVKHLIASNACVPDLYSIGIFKDDVWLGSKQGDVTVYHYKQ